MVGVQRDYTALILGIVAFVGLGAMLLMTGLDLDISGDRRGAATQPPGPVIQHAYETTTLVLGEDDTIQTPHTEYKIILLGESGALELQINDRTLTPTQGRGEPLDRGAYLYYASVTDDTVTLQFADPWRAPVCDGLTRQTGTSGPDAACCEGTMTALPSCPDDAPSAAFTLALESTTLAEGTLHEGETKTYETELGADFEVTLVHHAGDAAKFAVNSEVSETLGVGETDTLLEDDLEFGITIETTALEPGATVTCGDRIIQCDGSQRVGGPQ